MVFRAPGEPLTPDIRREAAIAEAERRGVAIPPELEVWRAEREAMRRGILVYPTFAAFVDAMNPGDPSRPALADYEHMPKLIDVAERVVAADLMRVMVLLPPRYFKTETFGRLLSAYYLFRHTRRIVGLTSYTAHRAWEISESARNYYVRAGGLLGKAQADERWLTQSGGELWAVGMGGAITGRGYHLGIVDDPIHPEQAKSPAYQRRFANWFPETWLSRQEPVPNAGDHVGQILLVMQRLGNEDPIDFLFRSEIGEGTEEKPQHWHVVVMDEIKSDEPLGRWSGPRGLPPTCTLESDKRKIGTVLAPLRFTKRQVTQLQRSSGPLVTAAQRQQRPMAPEGDFWLNDWFNTYDVLPSHAFDGGRDWDTAYTKEERNTASAAVHSFRGPTAPKSTDGNGAAPAEFPIYIEDVWWDWLEFPQLVERMRTMDGPHYVEAKATGKSAVQALAVYGIRAKEVPVLGDKLARASAVQPTVANGRVWINARVVQKLLWGERQGLLRVTAESLQLGDGGLDVNDAFVQALHRHLGIGGKRKRVAAIR